MQFDYTQTCALSTIVSEVLWIDAIKKIRDVQDRLMPNRICWLKQSSIMLLLLLIFFYSPSSNINKTSKHIFPLKVPLENMFVWRWLISFIALSVCLMKTTSALRRELFKTFYIERYSKGPLWNQFLIESVLFLNILFLSVIKVTVSELGFFVALKNIWVM